MQSNLDRAFFSFLLDNSFKRVHSSRVYHNTCQLGKSKYIQYSVSLTIFVKVAILHNLTEVV